MEDINNRINSDLSSQPISNISSQLTPKKNIYKYLFFISFFVLLTCAFFYYFSLSKNNQITNIEGIKEKSESTSTWSKPTSTDQLIPIVKDDKLYYYSLTNKKLQLTEYKTSWGSGSAGFGQDKPLVSPDGKYIAFINKDDNNSLYLLSGGSQKAVKLTDYSVEYINSWSTDSSKILFNSKPDNLITRKEGEMIPPTWEANETFIKKYSPGFHYFNINTGEDINLYPLLNAEYFIDSKNILVEMAQDGNVSNKRLVIFNVDNFTADYSTVNFVIKSFSSQRSFTADGKIWVNNFDNGRTEDGTKIVYSNFPSLEGDVIDSEKWAIIQKPLISPSGKYVAYQKADLEIAPGRRLVKTIIWDSNTKKIIKEIEGISQYWINSNTLLIGISRDKTSTNENYLSSFNLLNISTNETESFSIN